MSEPTPEKRRAVGADLIIPVAASLYAVYYVYSIWDFPQQAQYSGFMLAGLLLVLTGLFFVRIRLGVGRGLYSLKVSGLLGPAESRNRRLAFFGLIIVYMLIVEWTGFTLTTFLFLAASLAVLGIRPIRRVLVFAGVAALSGWFFFIVLLGTRFPRGPFEELVALAF